jgi:hypothetical protein
MLTLGAGSPRSFLAFVITASTSATSSAARPLCLATMLRARDRCLDCLHFCILIAWRIVHRNTIVRFFRYGLSLALLGQNGRGGLQLRFSNPDYVVKGKHKNAEQHTPAGLSPDVPYVARPAAKADD